MDFNKKISTLNTYELIKNYLNREGISSHTTKHLSTATLKPVDDIFSSIINDSFAILKFQENQNRSNYFKYIISSDSSLSISTYDRLEASSSAKNIVGVDYNNNSLFYILSIGNTFTIVTPNNIINYESLTLKESQKLTNEIGKKYIVKIACGESHCLFLTHAGMIYSMGDNSYGQLGIGQNNTKESKEGLMVKDLLNYRISDIASGKNHSICFGVVREMTKAGSATPNNNNIVYDPKTSYYLFGWGDNSFNQIGIRQVNRNKLVLKPSKIFCKLNTHNPAIIGEELINISCGLDFTALLFRNGKLLTFGDNQYNQLIYKENEIFPNEVSNYIPKKIGKIAKIFPSKNSLMFITEFNKMIIFGKYNEPNINEIKVIDLIDNYDSNKYIFTDQILKIIFFNNENINKNIIKDINSVKIENFLVNPKNENNNLEQKTIKNNLNMNNYSQATNMNIQNNNNTNNALKTDKDNNFTKKDIPLYDNNTKNDNNNEKILNKNKDINNKIQIETNNNNIIVESNISTNNNVVLKTKGELNTHLPTDTNKKNINFKINTNKRQFQNIPKQKSKNNYNSKTLLTKDTAKKLIHNVYINKNSPKLKTEPKKGFNGVEEKNDAYKPTKTVESNGNSSQNKQNNDLTTDMNDNSISFSTSFHISNKDNNTSTSNELSDRKINMDNKCNNKTENEDGFTNKDRNIILYNVDTKNFLNKNVLKNKLQIASSKNRYDDENNNSYSNDKNEIDINTKELPKPIPIEIKGSNEDKNKNIFNNMNKNIDSEIKKENNGDLKNGSEDKLHENNKNTLIENLKKDINNIILPKEKKENNQKKIILNNNDTNINPNPIEQKVEKINKEEINKKQEVINEQNKIKIINNENIIKNPNKNENIISLQNNKLNINIKTNNNPIKIDPIINNNNINSNILNQNNEKINKIDNKNNKNQLYKNIDNNEDNNNYNNNKNIREKENNIQNNILSNENKNKNKIDLKYDTSINNKNNNEKKNDINNYESNFKSNNNALKPNNKLPLVINYKQPNREINNLNTKQNISPPKKNTIEKNTNTNSILQYNNNINNNNPTNNIININNNKNNLIDLNKKNYNLNNTNNKNLDTNNKNINNINLNSNSN